MTQKIKLLVFIPLLALSSCLFVSVNKFYNTKDISPNDNIIGKWRADQGVGEYIIIKHNWDSISKSPIDYQFDADSYIIERYSPTDSLYDQASLVRFKIGKDVYYSISKIDNPIDSIIKDNLLIDNNAIRVNSIQYVEESENSILIQDINIDQLIKSGAIPKKVVKQYENDKDDLRKKYINLSLNENQNVVKKLIPFVKKALIKYKQDTSSQKLYKYDVFPLTFTRVK